MSPVRSGLSAARRALDQARADHRTAAETAQYFSGAGSDHSIPELRNNHKVRYRSPARRVIPSGPNRTYLDRIVALGFDGTYIDIIDAFTDWDEEGVRPRAQSRLDMINLVKSLATYARVTHGRPGFLVFPQNGIDVVRDANDQLDSAGSQFLAAISGVGVEDLFWNETTREDPEDTNYRIGILDQQYQAAGALVVLVDYVWNPAAPTGAANVYRTNDFESKALSRGYIPYAGVTDRGLDEIITFTATGGLIAEQPKANTFIVFRDGFENGTTGRLVADAALSAIPDGRILKTGPTGRRYSVSFRWHRRLL